MKRFSFIVILSTFVWGHLSAQEAGESGKARDKSVTFCSYNLKNYLKMQRFVQGTRTEDVGKPTAEVEAVIRFLVDIHPDILGVCEIGTENDLADLQSRLKEEGLDLPHAEHAHGGDPSRSLALLSRFPIVATHSQQDLKYQIDDQMFAVNRGFLDATVELKKGFQLRCVGVHLKSKREVPEADEMLMRRNEAHLLRQHLEGILKEDPSSRIAVYGDFNENRNGAPIVEIEGVPGMDLSMMDITLKDTRGQTWTHYWQGADVYSRFDYFFVSRPLQVYVDKKRSYVYDVPEFYSGSDHRPIVMKIDLVKNAKR